MTRRAFFLAVPAVAALFKPAAAGHLRRVETVAECKATPGTYVVKTNLAGDDLDGVVFRRLRGGYIKIR